jgi:hypothetical protein
MAGQNFKRGVDFPNEGFVQLAVARHFEALGFVEVQDGHADYAGLHPVTGARWRVEAKGMTTAVGLDFRTGLGQLLQGMSNQQANHGLAIPNTPQFRRQVQAVPAWVREVLRLHWFFVREDGAVIVDSP